MQSLYNGNISETLWKTAYDFNTRHYGYAYDKLNRLTHAYFTKPEDSNEDGAYNEYLTYDKNGNILSLFRTGKIVMDTNPIDILSYKYNGNQLQEVDDETNSPQGFLDGNIGSLDYEYDLNGNLKKDNNKGITNITYNHLNLPKEIIFNTGNLIRYTYNAMGQKITKTVKTGAEFAVTDYRSGFQYRSSYTEAGGNQEEPRLQYFPTAEGYVEWLDGHPRYVYNYTDHLGNIRLSYAYDENVNMLRIIEENNYYPFGLKHQNYNNTRLHFELINDEVILHQVPFSVGDGKYNKKFGSKDWQEELGLNVYDFEARFYDPATPHFWQMDPLAEEFFEWSPYNYTFNSPVVFTDPDGKNPILGAAIGAFAEYASIVGSKMLFEHMNFSDANSDLTWRDGLDIGIAAGFGAATGAIDGGITKFASWLKSPTNQKIMIRLLEVGVSALESSLKQLYKDEDFDLKAILSGALAEVGMGHLLKTNVLKEASEQASKNSDVASEKVKDLAKREKPNEKLVKKAKEEAKSKKETAEALKKLKTTGDVTKSTASKTVGNKTQKETESKK